MPRNESGWSLLRSRSIVSSHGRKIEHWDMVYNLNPEDPTPLVESYLMIGEPDYVMVAGVTVDDKLVMIVEDKVAEGPSLQLIAGAVKVGETPVETALREFGEESPWHATQITPVGKGVQRTDVGYSTTPGNCGAKACHMFLATGLEPSPQKLEESEKIKPHLVSTEIAYRCAFTGEIVPGIGLPVADISSCLCIIRAITEYNFNHKYPKKS